MRYIELENYEKNSDTTTHNKETKNTIFFFRTFSDRRNLVQSSREYKSYWGSGYTLYPISGNN